MTSDEYRDHLQALSLTQNEAGRLFGVHAGTGRRWASEGPPEAVAMLLRICERLQWSKEYLAKIAKE